MQYWTDHLLSSLSRICLGTFMILIALACENPDVNENIYGKWYEPVEGGGIELRPNGIAFWYGEEGSFEVEVSRVNHLMCGLSQLGCYYGDVRINVNNRVYQTRYYERVFNAATHTWHMSFENPVNTPSGRQISTLRMQRVEQLTGPQVHVGFTRMGTGLEEYYTGDGEYFQVSNQLIRSHFNVGSNASILHRWNDNEQSWTLIDLAAPAQVARRFVMGDSLIYTTDGYYSRNAGLTFGRTQTIDDIPVDAEVTHTVILNQEVISLLRVMRDDNEISNEVWALDLTTDQPIWIQRHRFIEGDFLASLIVAPVANALIISWLNDEGPLRSIDGGYTWSPIQREGIPCEDNFLVNHHPVGCWCATQENRYVYDARQDRWMTLLQGGWSNQVIGIPHASVTAEYPLFTIETNQLILIGWHGERRSTIQVPADIEGGRLKVFSDRLLYPYYVLWTAPFTWQ